MPDPSWNEWQFWVKDSESVRNLAFTIGSIAAIIGGTIGIVLATIRSVAAWRQSRAALETQVTQLFVNAIEFLADSKKIELRIGAIYSLERIAQNSRTDRSRVMEVLYAFLREGTVKKIMDEPETISSTRTLPADIQACLDVIARNPARRGLLSGLLNRSTARLSLEDIDLRHADLRGAKFRKASLAGVDLTDADLRDADFREADLSDATLVNVKLQASKLTDADLSGANIENANLGGAKLRLAKLNGAIFNRADLSHADLDRANLKEASFLNANLSHASFRGADLTRAKFSGSLLTETDFRDSLETKAAQGSVTTIAYPTKLDGADFTDVDRTKAKFQIPALGVVELLRLLKQFLHRTFFQH
jgi:uncharacterized protein YjbI with pentapeptide repeats